MTCCMYKEYESKIRMVQEQWLKLKMKPLSDHNLKIYYLVRGESTGGRGMSNFWPVGDGGGVPHSAKT